MSQPIEIFCCVAESDRSFLEKLSIQLALQQQQGIIKLWEKSQISPGALADEEIQRHLISARIFLLLISADFLADHYCYDQVLKAALERHTRGEALTIPVIVRPAHYQDVPGLKRLQVLPKDGQPIIGQSNQENALWEVTKEINKAIQKMEVPLVEPNSEVILAERALVVEDRPKTGEEKIPSSLPQKRRSVRKFPLLTGGAVGLILLVVVLVLTFGPTLHRSSLIPFPNQHTPSATSTHSDPTLSNTYGGSSSPTVLNQSPTPPHSGQPSLQWAVQIGTQVYSSPTVANGVVYVGSDSPNNNKVYALDASTGQQKWTFPTGGNVNSSPTVQSGVVYVGSDDGNEYAIDANTGQQKWAVRTGAAMLSSAAVVNGVLYVGSGSDGKNLYALDASTGQQKWTFSDGSAVYSSPTVVNGVVYIGTGNGKVYAIDASTGQQKWTSPFTFGREVHSPPTVVNGVVYVASMDYNVYALDANTGQLKWTFPTGKVDWPQNWLPRLRVTDGVLYIGSADHNVYALDANTGHEIWAFTTGDQIYSSPTVVNGVLYIGSNDHKIYALDATNGQLEWTIPTGERVQSSPIVVNGVLYVGSLDGKVYALMLPR